MMNTMFPDITVIDNENDKWTQGHTIRHDAKGAVENVTHWTRITDAYHRKAFWVLLPPVQLFEENGFTITEENANYLQKIFEEDWVAGVYYFYTAVGPHRQYGNDVAKLILNELSALANEENLPVEKYMDSFSLARICDAIFTEMLIEKKHFREVVLRFRSGEFLDEIVHDTKYAPVKASLVDEVIDSVLKENADKLDGTDKILNWLVGQVMKRVGGKANANDVKTKIKERI